MATISNLFIDAGSDYSSIITVETPSGNPLNLTGYTVKAQMRKSPTSSQFFNFTATVHDAANGKIRLSMLAAYNSTIPAGRWLFDVEITHTSGLKKRVIEGVVTVTPQITQT